MGNTLIYLEAHRTWTALFLFDFEHAVYKWMLLERDCVQTVVGSGIKIILC
jgi:hypothetical protein